jgi:hypothetical protein
MGKDDVVNSLSGSIAAFLLLSQLKNAKSDEVK